MVASSDDLFRKAIDSFRAGRLDDTERQLKSLLARQPDHVAALNVLGVLLASRHKYTEAESYLQSALKINSNSDATFYNYGIVLKGLGRPAEAFEHFSKALAINPAVAETWNNRGTVHNDLHRYKEALGDFDRAIALLPNFPAAFCNKGKSLESLDRHDEALAAYEKALAQNPNLTEAWLARGNISAKLKRYDDARTAYERVLALKPDDAKAWLGCGNALIGLKRADDALAAFEKALGLQPELADAWLGRGNVLYQMTRYDEALAAYDRALALNSEYAEAWPGRGNALTGLKRYDEAFAAFDRALELRPDLAGAWLGRGNVLVGRKSYDEALGACDKALALMPDLAEAWLCRGHAFFGLKRCDEAMVAYQNALARTPDFAVAWLSLGNVFSRFLRYDEARAAYRHALTHNPNLFGALQALTLLLLSEGNITEACDLARRALASNETPEAKILVAACLRSPHMHPSMGDLRELLVRALLEPWARPSELAPVCARFLVLNDAIRDSMARAAKAWPKLLLAEELAGSSSLAKFAEDRLLRALLESTPVCTIELEQFSTGLRFSLLAATRSGADDVVAEPILNLYCALARQCFINSYVFAQSDAEIEQVRTLRDGLVAALASGAAISALSLVAVAAYVPLHTLPRAEALLDRPWPDAVSAVLAQQVGAPIEEQRLRSSMPVLTAIDDDVSMQVRAQYEEHPYPQWVKPPPAGDPGSVNELMHEKFPLSSFVDLEKSGKIDILVAGCGTGQHPIDTACHFKASQVLAVDLSLTCLCYAQRQTRALGLNTIHYAQADIMNLSSIGRTFEVIESGGVLHHLADPFAGWRVLLLLLRPGGIMRLGLYSEIARRDIVAARDFIAARGYRPTADDIRRCRQELLDCADGTPLKNVTIVNDFFSLSECRDFLFHVKEHRLTLPEIAAFIAENNLQFLGFELDLQARQNYARQFPGDIAMTDLAQWHRYETDNPRTFFHMYQFWVQRK